MPSGNYGFQRFSQAAEHSALFFGGCVNAGVVIIAKKAQPLGNDGLRDDLEDRTGRDLDEARKVDF